MNADMEERALAAREAHLARGRDVSRPSTGRAVSSGLFSPSLLVAMGGHFITYSHAKVRAENSASSSSVTV